MNVAHRPAEMGEGSDVTNMSKRQIEAIIYTTDVTWYDLNICGISLLLFGHAENIWCCGNERVTHQFILALSLTDGAGCLMLLQEPWLLGLILWGPARPRAYSIPLFAVSLRVRCPPEQQVAYARCTIHIQVAPPSAFCNRFEMVVYSPRYTSGWTFQSGIIL